MGEYQTTHTSCEREILNGIRYTARKAYEDILERRRGEKPLQRARLIFGVLEGSSIRLLRLVMEESGREPDEALFRLSAQIMGISDEHCLFHSGGGSITAILREDAPDFSQPAALETALAGRLARLGGRAARNMRILVSSPALTASEDAATRNAFSPEHEGGLDAALRHCHSQLEQLHTHCHMRPGVRVFVYDGPSARHLRGMPFPQLPLEVLEHALHSGENVTRALDEFFEALFKEQLPEPVTALCLYRLIGLLGRVCYERGLTAAEPLEQLAAVIGSAPQSCESAVRTLCARLFPPAGTIAVSPNDDLLRYIRLHCRTPLNLRHLSEALGRPPGEISRAVREITGRSFRDYLNELRVEYAKVLIASSGLKLSVVSRESGFADYSQFVQKFQRVTGMLPSQYKREFG